MQSGRGTYGSIGQDFKAGKAPPIKESATVKKQNFLEEDVGDDFDPRFSNQSDPRTSMQQYNNEYRGTYNNDSVPSNQKNFRQDNVDYGNPGATSTTSTRVGTGQPLNQLFDCGQGRPLQLVSANVKTGKFALNVDAFEELRDYKGNIAFVTLAGKYRTGKSFLLNRLLNLKGKGFTVNPTTEACTEGIWIWSQPVFIEKDNMHVFFLDTEGASSTDRSQTHDAKIFSLAILLSSLFMFNSYGTIDENAINELSLTTHLSKNIAVASDGGVSSEHALSYYTPKFIWLLRDFMLEIQDPSGKPISAAQYLENALTDQSTFMKANANNKKIRHALLTYFKDRDCVTLIRPVEDEKLIHKLNSLSDNQLRAEFLKQINNLREKILAKVTPKQLRGVNLNITMYIAMVQKYVEAINEGQVPNISSAWEHLVIKQCEDALEEAKALYTYAIHEYFYKIPEHKDIESVYNTLRSIRDGTLEKFNKITATIDKSEQVEQFKGDIKAFIDDQEKLCVEKNEQDAAAINEELLRDLAQQMRDNISQAVYDANSVDNFIDDVNQIISEYDKRGAQSITKAEILVNFLQHFLTEAMNALVAGIKKKQNQTENKSAYESASFKKKEEVYTQTINALQQKLTLQDEKIKDLESQKKSQEEASKKAKAELQKAKTEEEDKTAAMKAKHEQEKQQLEADKIKQKENLTTQYNNELAKIQKSKKACCTIF